MIDNNILLQNPLVPSGYYYAKLIGIETEESDYIYPKIQATLELHRLYGFPPKTVFHAIIHPTPNAHYHFKNFLLTFIPERDITKTETAIGMYGSVELYDAQWNEIQYSCVKFIYQPLMVRVESLMMYRAEHGEE